MKHFLTVQYLSFCVSTCLPTMNKFTLRFRKHHLFTFLLLCLSIVAGLLLCETVLRFSFPNSNYIWPPHLKTGFRVHQNDMPGISGQSRFTINSLGIRGDELAPSQTYRFLTIGGSTTECLYLDDSETWPYLLQQTLNENIPNQIFWVGNAGMSGKTTRHHLAAMQYLPLKEMRIDSIILLIGINDYSIRLSQDEDYDPNFLSKPESMNDLLYETFTGGSYPDPNGPYIKKTAIWQMLKKFKRTVLRVGTQDNIQDLYGKVYANWRQHRQQAAEIRNELPDLSSALEEYARNINKMIDIAREKSIRLIFITQPTIWKPGLPDELDALLWMGGVGNYQKDSGKVYYSVEALERGMKKYNDTLLKICQERHVESIDLAPMLDKDTTVFYDDVHFNKNGAQKVSRILSNYVLGLDLHYRR